MFNLNDFKVEQEIARARYQAFIQARQVEKIIKLNKTAQPKKFLVFQRLLTWLGHHLVKLGCHLQRSHQEISSSVC